MKFHSKLKTISTGNNSFVFIPHTKQKNLLCNKYSDIRFWSDSSFDIQCYPVPAGF